MSALLERAPGSIAQSLVLSRQFELWYHFGCRAAALASAASRLLDSLFGSFSPRGARSKGDQQPDGRVAPQSEAFKPPWVSIQGLSPPMSCAQGRLVNTRAPRQAMDAFAVEVIDHPFLGVTMLAALE